MNVADQDLSWLAKYQTLGPRYTSYPTADRFSTSFDVARYIDDLREHNATEVEQPWSLYLHLPFCSHLCFYCGCNKIITKDKHRGEDYLINLRRELQLYEPLLGERRRVRQLHLGGGTPTFFSAEQLQSLMNWLGLHFSFENGGERSIEVDPRTVTADGIFALRDMGFNRLSLGVQDFDAQVQKAVHRVQSETMTLALIDAAREAGFDSISVDLIYGLPKQTLAGFDRTLASIVGAHPDRVALYGYAHLPRMFYPQTRIDERDLPKTEEKLAIMQLAIARLLEAGYVYIGMDHFARPEDELAVAQRSGALQRNFQGYSTQAGNDLLALGISAISRIGNWYAQNYKAEDEYYGALQAGVLPITRGYELTRDDRIRAAVIQSIMCQGDVDLHGIEMEFGIDFATYFAAELNELQPLIDEHLMTFDGRSLRATPTGRFVLRNIAMVFDWYLRTGGSAQRYSKVL